MTVRANGREIRELTDLRLDLDMTYDELAAAIPMSKRNLVRLLTMPRVGMHDRTRAKIRRYIERTRAKEAARQEAVTA